MPGAVSLAEHYRAHREAFELALRLGCTPKEAERRLRAETRARRQVCGTAAPIGAEQEDMVPMDGPQELAPADFADWSASWMMRD
jgi:hypothetical protein